MSELLKVIDRQVQFGDRFTFTDNGDGTATIVPILGTVTELGTNLTAENLNKITSRVVQLVKDTGTSSTIVVSVNGLESYADIENTIMIIKANVDKTANPNINLNNLGVKTLVKFNNGIATMLTQGEIKANTYISVVYDSANDRVVILSNESNIKKTITDVDNKIVNSFNSNPNKYAVNQKDIEVGQDESLWTEAAVGTTVTQTDDANLPLIGTQSIKLAIGGAGTAFTQKQNITLDLSTLLDGSISTDEDDIILAIKSSVGNNVNMSGSYVSFDQATTASVNFKRRTFAGVTLIDNEWEFIQLKKSDFATGGSGAWNNIQSIRLEFTTTGATDVNFQLIQLVKDNGYFQHNGNIEAIPNSNSNWYVGLEFEEIVMRDLNPSTNKLALKFNNLYNDFTANSIVKKQGGAVGILEVLNVAIDENNYISIDINSNNLRLIVVENNVILSTSSIPLSVVQGDIINATLNKLGSRILINVYKNHTPIPTPLSASTTLNGLSLSIASQSNSLKNQLSNSIGISHAHHSDVSEVAKSLQFKRKNGVFTSNEINHNEAGIDTANNRLYLRYDETQLIYFQGTVV